MLYVDQMPPAVLPFPLLLAVVSAMAGVMTVAVFRLLSRPDAIRQARRSVQAQLLALRLFGDEPALMWQAQRKLLVANARYLRAILLPAVAAALPLVLAWPYLESLFGRAKIPPGAATVLTVRLRKNTLPQASIDTPAGLRAATPAVRIQESGEIAWRLEALAPVSAPVHIHVGNAEVARQVRVGNGLGYLPETTRSSSPVIESVRVVYRRSRLQWIGVTMPWELWFILLSTLTAWAASHTMAVRCKSKPVRKPMT